MVHICHYHNANTVSHKTRNQKRAFPFSDFIYYLAIILPYDSAKIRGNSIVVKWNYEPITRNPHTCNVHLRLGSSTVLWFLKFKVCIKGTRWGVFNYRAVWVSLGKKCVVGAERRALQGWRDCLGHGPSSECISSCLSPHLKATGSIVQGGSLWAFCNCLSKTVICLIYSVLSMKVKINP